jgi:glycerophosphoryl diester phosphodiesterase
MTRFAALFVSVTVLACSQTDQAQPSADTGVDTMPREVKCAPGDNVQMCGKNLVIAHRGGAKIWPEETVFAFGEAVKAGADVLELDVHGTVDGKIVCNHDDLVDRTTDGTGPIKDKTWEQLQMLDAGAKFTTDGGKTFPYKGMGIKLALLEEVLAKFPTMPFSVEIKQVKPSIVDGVIAVIEKANMGDKVVIASFDDDTIRDVRAKRPKWATSLAGGEIVRLLQIKSMEDIGTYVPPTKLFQAPHAAITADRMAAYRMLGIRVHVWTVDDKDDMERLWKLGVHGIMSDDPVLLKTVTKSLGLTDH